MTAVSLLVINYRSSALAADAIATARAASSQPLQAVVVDNSVDSAEADALRGVADTVVVSERNVGYAGGINAGRRSCDGDVIVVSNPDVRFGESAIDQLIAADASVAGPALFWDDAHCWMLPPAELHTRREVLDRVVATRSRVWARRRAQRRFLGRVAFWSLDRTTRVRALSGAVMAIRANAFDAAGGFDERFPLYFEENDFLRRVQGAIVYVPSAQCRHLYNQSAAGSADAASLYARSELLYLRKWGGALAKNFEGALQPQPPQGGNSDNVVFEASPLPSFETAAGHFGNDITDISGDIWNSYRGDVLYLRTVDSPTGRVLRSWTKARIRA
ncbi:MAG TPA: glycosyltransferase, partial [Thermoanaerobaculia bacterium]|jgi:GT2 family glycosyltransferase|nr:glycosyltransferase [Thermoanaerobaculia bacterium]